eukprot:2652404-Karenia_brevis.AAC.1
MAKYPYGKKTKFVKEEDMEQDNDEEDPEPVDEPRLVDAETADAFRRLGGRDKIRLTCRRCSYENPPGTNVSSC